MNSQTLDLLLAFGGYAAKATTILALAWVGTLLCRRAAAATRHAIWVAGFVGIALLPFLALVLPKRDLAVIKAPRAAQDAPLPMAEHLEVGTVPDTEAVSTATDSVRDIPPVAVSVAPSVVHSLAPVTVPSLSVPLVANDGLSVVGTAVAIWAGGLIVVLVPALFAYLTILRLRRRGTRALSLAEFEPAPLARMARVRRPWDLRICLSPVPPAAMTWGLVRPVVLLPQESEAWPRDRVDAVLLHELAHVRRFDSASQLLSLGVCALYWFHPAVWLCARAMRAEAEAAADDCVLQSGITPSAYAAALVRIAADLGRRRQPLLTFGISVMKESKIEARVRAILDPSARRRGATVVEALSVLTLASLAIVPLAGLHPGVYRDPGLASIDPFLSSDIAVAGNQAATKKKHARRHHVASKKTTHANEYIVISGDKVHTTTVTNTSKYIVLDGGGKIVYTTTNASKPVHGVRLKSGTLYLSKPVIATNDVFSSRSPAVVSGSVIYGKTNQAAVVAGQSNNASDVLITTGEGELVQGQNSPAGGGKTVLISGDKPGQGGNAVLIQGESAKNDVYGVMSGQVGATKSGATTIYSTVKAGQNGSTKSGPMTIYSTVKSAQSSSMKPGSVWLYTTAKPGTKTTSSDTFTVLPAGTKVKVVKSSDAVKWVSGAQTGVTYQWKTTRKAPDGAVSVTYMDMDKGGKPVTVLGHQDDPKGSTYSVELEYKLAPQKLHDAKVELWEAQARVAELRAKVRKLAREKKSRGGSSTIRVITTPARPASESGNKDKLLAEARERALEVRVDSLITQRAKAMSDANRAKIDMKVLEAQLKQAAEEAREARRRQEVGVLTKSEADRAALELLEAQQRLKAAVDSQKQKGH